MSYIKQTWEIAFQQEKQMLTQTRGQHTWDWIVNVKMERLWVRPFFQQ